MSPKLMALSGPLKGRTVLINEDECSVGRGPNNQVRLNDNLVSRNHCVIRRVADQFEIENLGAANGTFVNSEAVEKRTLAHFNQLAIGDSVFLFLLDEDEAPSPASRVQFDDAEMGAGATTQRQTEDRLDLLDTEIGATPSPDTSLSSPLKELLKINQAINAAGQPKALAQQLLDSIFDLTPTEQGVILRIVEIDGGVDVVAEKSRSAAPDESTRVNPVSVRRASYDRRPLLFNDDALPQSLLVVPLIAYGRMLGVIYLIADHQRDRFNNHHLDLVTAIADLAATTLEKAWRVEALEQETRRLDDELSSQNRLIGESQKMKEVHQKIAKVASSDATALICGESGTGKELVARAIHDQSSRAGKPFMAINCAAIPETLLESELFGYEPGAFSGAAKQLKKGKLEAAHGGTVFLDEVGEMSPALQAKLLRVLSADPEAKPEFERLGGTRPVQVDIRVIAATNRDLEAAVKAGAFREDLYYRLRVFPITLPPLRERREDVKLLARQFARKYGEKRQPQVKFLAPETITCLESYHWPGNVRELESAIYYAVLHHDTGLPDETEFITPADLPEEIRAVAPVTGAPNLDINQATKKAAEEAKRRVIREAVEQAAGNLTEAAILLGIKPPNLHRLISELGLRAEVEQVIRKLKPKAPPKK